MGQLFSLAPVPTGMRCTCSDYGAAGMVSTRYTALVSPLTYPISRYEVSPSPLTVALHLQIELKVWGG